MNYNSVTDNILKELQSIVGMENILTDPADLICYAIDHAMTKYSEWFKLRPEAVVLPSSTKEVVEIVRLANREKIPITPRGGGCGYTGNAVPAHRGLLLDTKRMNKIVEIDEENMLVTAQAGIQIETLDRELRKHGLMYADDPTSFPTNTLGGRISTSGIGYTSSRYGCVIDQGVGLEVVLPTGDILRTGGGGAYKVIKSSVGYPLRYLFYGAQGTLGVVTEATIRVFPIPEAIFSRSFSFNNLDDAFATATRLYKTGIRFALLMVTDKTRSLLSRKLDPQATVAEGTLSFVLMGTKDEVEGVKGRIFKICEEMGGKDLGPEVGKTDYEARHEFDTAFPGIAHVTGLGPANAQNEEYGLLPVAGKKLIRRVREITRKYGIPDEEIFCAEQWGVFPYALLFVSYRLNERAEERWEDYMKVTEELAEEVLKLGGTLSACHGLGLRRLDEFVKRELGDVAFEIMKKIKRIIDPNNIMNPGKMGLDAAYEQGSL